MGRGGPAGRSSGVADLLTHTDFLSLAMGWTFLRRSQEGWWCVSRDCLLPGGASGAIPGG